MAGSGTPWMEHFFELRQVPMFCGFHFPGGLSCGYRGGENT